MGLKFNFISLPRFLKIVSIIFAFPKLKFMSEIMPIYKRKDHIKSKFRRRWFFKQTIWFEEGCVEE